MMWQVLRSGVQRLIIQVFGSQLRRNMSSGVVATAANVLALGISYPVYLHYLGYEKYGLWLVLATVLAFAQMGMLGIRQAVMKLVAEEYGRENLRGIQSYVAMAWTILATTGSVALLIILLFKNQIIGAFRLSQESTAVVSQLLPYIGLLTIYVFLVHVLSATLSGLGRMDIANYIQVAGRIAAVGMSVLLLSFDGGVESLLIGNVLSYVVIHIISLVFIRHETKVRFLRLGNWSWQRFKRLLTFGSGVFGGSLMSMLLDPFNKLMLSRYAGVASIPVYEIAFKGSMQVRAVVEAGFRALVPEVSRLDADNTTGASPRIGNIYHRSMKLVLWAGVPLFIFTILIARYTPVIKLWLGGKFVDELPEAVCIMLLGALLGLLGVPAYYTLLGLGRVRKTFVAHVIVAGINATLLITIVLVSGMKLSVSIVALALVAGTGVSTVYLLWEKSRPLRETGSQDEKTVRLSSQSGFTGNYND